MNDRRRGRAGPRRRADATEEVLFGLNAVEQALATDPERVIGLFVSTRRDDARLAHLVELAADAGVTAQRAAPETLDRMADGGRHQGVVLRRRPLPEVPWSETLARLKRDTPPLLLALDGVEDPHNLGACLRTAAGAGVDTVLVPRSRGAPVNATARRVASGGAELVHVQPVPNLARSLSELAHAGWLVVGLAGESSEPLDTLIVDRPILLVAGSEADGLRALTRRECDRTVRIPMAPGLESLNVSVATGVALFTLRRGLLDRGLMLSA